jgi:hypothetical protein
VYSVTIIGNVEQCRTEVEIRDSQGAVTAIVYETSDGWHTDVLVEQLNQAATDFQTAVENAKESVSHYLNRRGENPPENATRGACSLWLMAKDDGRANGREHEERPKVRVNADCGEVNFQVMPRLANRSNRSLVRERDANYTGK